METRDLQERARIRDRAIAEYLEAVAPIVADLKDAGFDVASLDEVRTGGARYREALPVLERWLSRTSSFAVKESIVRCMTYPWAKGAPAQLLIDEYHRVPKSEHHLRWAIGNAIEVLVAPALASQILEIVRDPANGRSRQMFVIALGKLPNQGAEPLLIRLLEDPDVAGHAASALGRLRAKEAVAPLEALLRNPSSVYARQAAIKALTRITGTPPPRMPRRTAPDSGRAGRPRRRVQQEQATSQGGTTGSGPVPRWYACTDWTPQTEAEFFRRLKRARQGKARYLLIQAEALVDTGRPDVAATALSLIDLFLQEHYEPFLASSAFRTRAQALGMLGRWDEAFQAFEDALAARRAMPDVIDETWLEYPLTIARRRARERYPRALEILKEFFRPTGLTFPVEEFRYFATLALISADEGDREGASRWARKALAAAAKRGPASRHPDFGVVGMTDADVQIQLEQLVID